MLTNDEKRMVLERWDMLVLAERPNEDASALTGRTTLEVVAERPSNKSRYTMYLSGMDEGLTLEWDVSGWPGWYEPTDGDVLESLQGPPPPCRHTGDAYVPQSRCGRCGEWMP